MNSPPDPAARRFAILSVLRIAGALIAILGIAAGSGRIAAIPPVAGYALIVVGLVDLFLVPQLLARRWRTPPGA